MQCRYEAKLVDKVAKSRNKVEDRVDVEERVPEEDLTTTDPRKAAKPHRPGPDVTNESHQLG